MKRTLINLRNRMFEIPPKEGWAGSRSEETQMYYTDSLLNVLGRTKDIREITVGDISDLKSALLKSGNSPATVNRKLMSLSKMLGYALNMEWIDKKPLITKLREDNQIVVWFREEEKTQLFQAFRDLGYPEMELLTKFLLNTGFRIREALSLEWENCSDDVITLWDTKSGVPRSVPKTKTVRKILEELSHKEGGPFLDMTYGLVRYRWDKARKMIGKEGAKGWTLHGCRHTFCSNLVQRGTQIQVVGQLAGHGRDLAMTLRYAHLDPNTLSRAIRVLDDAPQKQPKKNL